MPIPVLTKSVAAERPDQNEDDEVKKAPADCDPPTSIVSDFNNESIGCLKDPN